MAENAQGSVKWFDKKKGYGFISRDEGDDVFVHYTAINGDGYRNLFEGQKVQFEIVDGKKGLEAKNLTPLE